MFHCTLASLSFIPCPAVHCQQPRQSLVCHEMCAILPCAGYRRLFGEAVARVQSLGGELVPIDLSSFDRAAHMLYENAFLAERYSSIRSFLEAKVGLQS